MKRVVKTNCVVFLEEKNLGCRQCDTVTTAVAGIAITVVIFSIRVQRYCIATLSVESTMELHALSIVCGFDGSDEVLVM